MPKYARRADHRHVQDRTRSEDSFGGKTLGSANENWREVMRLRMLAIGAAMVALPLFATTADRTALARVNGDPVSVQDLLDAFTTRHAGHAKFLGGYNEAREFLKILIDERLFIQEGYDIGLDQDETVAKSVDEFEKSKASAALI